MKIFYIDLFSGAGGTTTGIHLAGNPDVHVVACVNHDLNAIESHKANHPDCIHFVEDIRDFNVVIALKKIVHRLRREHPGCVIAIWASLECTNYSKAKGGLPRDADSRTLAEYMFPYLEQLKPEYLWIENVREFMAWGPLDNTGRPISLKNGRDYILWTNKVQNYGYDFDWQILNAADYGAYTSRERYFAQFAKSGLPIRWPEQTHSRQPKEGLFSPLKKWKAVREVLDLRDEGQSIFNRKKPLVENSLKRIYAGLIKFVANGETAFLKKYFSGRPMGKVISIESPAGTIPTTVNHALVQPVFLVKHFSGDPEHKSSSIERPAGTITTKDHHSVVHAQFLTSHYTNGGNISSIESPCPTIPTKDRFSQVTPQFLVNSYSAGGNTGSLDNPAPTVMSNPKSNLVTPWILDPNYTNIGTSVENPVPPIMACRKHRYLVNPQFNNKGGSVDGPCFTLIARMDKKPPYLVNAEEGPGIIVIYEDDSETMIKIKEFMALYGIIDIRMRMLKIPELLKIQGFPEGYVLKGTQTEQKKYIGNAVVTIMAESLIRANAEALNVRIEAMTA